MKAQEECRARRRCSAPGPSHGSSGGTPSSRPQSAPAQAQMVIVCPQAEWSDQCKSAQSTLSSGAFPSSRPGIAPAQVGTVERSRSCLQADWQAVTLSALASCLQDPLQMLLYTSNEPPATRPAMRSLRRTTGNACLTVYLRCPVLKQPSHPARTRCKAAAGSRTGKPGASVRLEPRVQSWAACASWTDVMLDKICLSPHSHTSTSYLPYCLHQGGADASLAEVLLTLDSTKRSHMVETARTQALLLGTAQQADLPKVAALLQDCDWHAAHLDLRSARSIRHSILQCWLAICK